GSSCMPTNFAGRLARSFVSLASIVPLIALATGAQALMAPEWYRKARAEAPYHIQVAVTNVVAPSPSPGRCTVEGEIVAVFKGESGKLRQGRPVSFPVSCMNPGDLVPIGGTIWTEIPRLQAARYIEAYLGNAGEGYRPALDQQRIIGEPS